MPKKYAGLFFLGIGILALSCSDVKTTKIQGQVYYTGSSEILLKEKPIHYKYAEKINHPVKADENGHFELTLKPDSTEVFFLSINDRQYPVVVQPGANLALSISRPAFPDSVGVDGYPEPWHQYYLSYRNEIRPIQKQIEAQMPRFRAGKPNNVTDLYEQRYRLAQRFLGDTPLDIYYYKAIGEYLVKRLEDIEYRRKYQNFNSGQERRKVIAKAKKLNFFSFNSLKAQRAGIRDFTNAYANTFGVHDRLEEKYGQELLQYDVNRLGYETLDSARVSVLSHINGRRALAYAKMHLIAERIGEMSPKTAEESYRTYLKNFPDFPAYTQFLKQFYRKVKAVSPGQPAVPFSLPDQYNNTVSMKDFRGKYVLLDFWAGWCISCLNEFPHMKELYTKYSRDEFEIVAISIEKDSLRWRQAIQRFDNPWPQLYGGNEFQQETFRAYRGGGIPFYILIDPEGIIARYNDVRPSFNLPEVLDSLIVSDINS